jgi:hypothetical protein
MFFGGAIAATLTPEDALVGWNWTFWNDVLKSVVQQLGDHSPLAPALVAPNSTLPITISGATAPDIEFCVREVPPYLFILASKRDPTNNVTVTFSGLPAKRMARPESSRTSPPRAANHRHLTRWTSTSIASPRQM